MVGMLVEKNDIGILEHGIVMRVGYEKNVRER